jgi:hypothetical protein
MRRLAAVTLGALLLAAAPALALLPVSTATSPRLAPHGPPVLGTRMCTEYLCPEFPSRLEILDTFAFRVR